MTTAIVRVVLRVWPRQVMPKALRLWLYDLMLCDAERRYEERRR